MSRTAKVALVTGASGGIGSAIALRLAASGYAVVVHYADDFEHADRVVTEIIAKGGSAVAIRADVGEPTEVRALFADARHALGNIDVVIHCAGIMPRSTIEAGDVALFDRVVRTNLRGSFIVLSEAAKSLSSGGRIVALSSSVVAKSSPTYGPYIASKAGLEGLVRVLANELRGRNITADIVAPGPLTTPPFARGESKAEIASLVRRAPLERLGAPRAIANVVAFLVGPDDGWANGQMRRVNGGFA
jgi:3-oxoacyl-[acyl-carrier protein] reductase